MKVSNVSDNTTANKVANMNLKAAQKADKQVAKESKQTDTINLNSSAERMSRQKNTYSNILKSRDNNEDNTLANLK